MVEGFAKVERRVKDAAELVEMVRAEPDPAMEAEIAAELGALQTDVRRMELARMLSGPHDASNAYVSINAGAGGTESCDWAEMLLRMYLRFAERRGWKTSILDYQPGDEAGIRSATFSAEGDHVYGYLRAEVGVHRLVRISPFDANKRRHTSFASVIVFPEAGEDLDIEIREEDLRIDTYRAGGKGGQHVNKTDSAVRITHLPTGIVVQCQNERSQHRNKTFALKVLRAKLYEIEEQKLREQKEALHGEKKEIGFGSQIRSYVLQPYQLIKDHRTGYESGKVDRVLDGDIEDFIESYLLLAGAGKPPQAGTDLPDL